jgi:hypothetical protein
MRTIARLMVPLVIFAAACGPDSANGTRMSDDLKKDLEASTADLQLATSAARPMRFVSELEQTNAAAPVQRTRAPRHVASRTAGTTKENTTSPAPEAPTQVQVAQVPTESPPTPGPGSDVPSVPTVAPRPVALPVDYPASGGSGRGQVGTGRGDGSTGVGIGDVIGVVIRGGGVGDDHCVPPRRPRGRGLPIPFPVHVIPQIRQH